MPTDYEKVKSLLMELGVGFDEIVNKDTTKSINCERDSHKKVGGYIGFSTEFQFDNDGKFISLNCWE